MKTRWSIRLVAAALVWAVSYPALATERHVPGEYGTIQAAINACVAGDVVIVADGTYTGTGNRDLDFAGRAITVRSASGDPNTCIIDCEGSGRGFYFHSGETTAAVVEGLTITNGSTVLGAGFYCIDWTGPTITNCIIRDGEAWSGGGIYCRLGCSPTISHCTLTGNTAATWDGGGIYCAYQSSPTITDCTIAENTAQGAGGGVYLAEDSDAVVSGCAITANTAVGSNGGGGVYCSGSRTTLTNCTFTGNNASSHYGGGVYCSSVDLTLTNCAIADNTAVDGGGVYFTYPGTLTIADCTVTGNTASGVGGGVSCSGGTSALTNCAITNNTAGSHGGLICSNSDLTMTDCTVSGNVAYRSGCGGMGVTGLTVQIIRCSVTSNWAPYGAGGATIAAATTGTISDCFISDNATYGAGGGLALDAYEAVLTLANCMITGNWAAEDGGGMACYGGGGGGHIEILNNVIVGNTADGANGGGIWVERFTVPVIRGCTISHNVAGGLGGGIYAPAYSGLPITGCILWADTPDEIHTTEGQPTVRYCDVQGGWAGIGNIDMDPLFVDPVHDDYHLSAGSACINAGDPNSFGSGEFDMDGEARVLGGRVDIGADEFTDDPFVFGDANCDGARTYADINAFVLALSNASAYRAYYPACYRRSADCNDDGVVSYGDINRFVVLLGGTWPEAARR